MEDTGNRERAVAVAAADLIFGSRIRAAAAAAGVRTRFARSEEQLLDAARDADLVIVDLDARWIDAARSIQRLKAHAATPIVAYVSHVRVDAVDAARAAGAERVLARSAFVRLLPEILSGC